MRHMRLFGSTIAFAVFSVMAALSCIAQDAGASADKVCFFQMGHEKAPFFEDAIHITQNSLYNDKTGYGWVHKGSRGEGQENLVARFHQPDCASVRDSIASYCVFWRGGKSR